MKYTLLTVECLDMSLLAEPPWTGISLSTFYRIARVSGNTRIFEINNSNFDFVFCDKCGDLRIPRFNPSELHITSDFYLSISDGLYAQHGQKYEYSKKKALRGVSQEIPVIKLQQNLRKNISLIPNYALDVLWFIEKNRISELFESLEYSSEVVVCFECNYRPVYRQSTRSDLASGEVSID